MKYCVAWKFYYFTHILKDEVKINKYNDRLWNFMNVKYSDKFTLNYEVLRTEIWNMSPEIFLKDEI